MKIALVYTSTTPELIETVRHEVSQSLGEGAELMHYEDPSILAEVREAGNVPAHTAARLVGMYMKAVQDGADILLNVCSSVGMVARQAQPLCEWLGVPLVRIDQNMCAEAAAAHRRIGVMATLPTTLAPTKATIAEEATRMGKQPELVDCLLDNAFGLDQTAFKARMLEAANGLEGKVDALLLAQGSMAYCAPDLAEATGLPVYSSPEHGAKALRREAEARGLL